MCVCIGRNLVSFIHFVLFLFCFVLFFQNFAYQNWGVSFELGCSQPPVIKFGSLLLFYFIHFLIIFQMFRIKLKAYRKSFRVTVIQKDESGIKGEYNMQKFRPRREVIEKLRQDIVDKAVAEVENLFNF